jgi:hypothetical protein
LLDGWHRPTLNAVAANKIVRARSNNKGTRGQKVSAVGKKRAASKGKTSKSGMFSPHKPAPHIASPATATEIIDQLGLSAKRKASATSIVNEIIAKLHSTKKAVGG